jgi:hypothetical protein
MLQEGGIEMSQHRIAVVSGAFLALFTSNVLAITITPYFDRASWEAASRVTVSEDFESLTPFEVPETGGRISAPYFRVDVDANHGGISVGTDGAISGTRGFLGDVHGFGTPSFNRFSFFDSARSTAFSVTAFGGDLAEVDEGGIKISTAGHAFFIPDGTSFFGVVADTAIDQFTVLTTGDIFEYYALDNFEFTPTWLSVYAGATHVTTSGATINATFTPNFGLTLDEAATIGGVDHFNWYQVINQDPYPPAGVTSVPYVDPPFGGGPAFGGYADNLPWYWDEQGATGTGYHLDDNILGNTLKYTDTPAESRLTAGQSIKFSTALAAILDDGSWDPLSIFSWETTFNGTSGGVTTRRNITPADAGSGTGGIDNLQQDILFERLPADVQQLMIQDGARTPIQSVPEPYTLLLVGIGMGLILVFQRIPKKIDMA